MAPVPSDRHLLRARDLIDARDAEPLDVAALARAASSSPAHFARSFRRAFGETPHQYLLSRRMERAAALLRDTDTRSPASAPRWTRRAWARHHVLRPLARHDPDGLPRVAPLGQPPGVLNVPNPPMFDAKTSKAVLAMVAQGGMGGFMIECDDCQATYEELSARGVEFNQPPTVQPYGIDAAFRDPSGNQARLVQRTDQPG